jgi:hypothetical protein
MLKQLLEKKKLENKTKKPKHYGLDFGLEPKNNTSNKTRPNLA